MCDTITCYFTFCASWKWTSQYLIRTHLLKGIRSKKHAFIHHWTYYSNDKTMDSYMCPLMLKIWYAWHDIDFVFLVCDLSAIGLNLFLEGMRFEISFCGCFCVNLRQARGNEIFSSIGANFFDYPFTQDFFWRWFTDTWN